MAKTKICRVIPAYVLLIAVILTMKPLSELENRYGKAVCEIRKPLYVIPNIHASPEYNYLTYIFLVFL